MPRFAATLTGLTLLLAVALAGPVQAKTKSSSSGDKPASSKVKKASGESAKSSKSGKSGKIKFMEGSAETTKERSTRLLRECKGRANAGACEGYTR